MNEIFNEEFIENVSSKILSLVLKDIDEKVEKIKKVEELPPYPNKSTVKKVLGIGNAVLDQWIAGGLPVMIWGEKSVRIDREDLKKFLEKTKN